MDALPPSSIPERVNALERRAAVHEHRISGLEDERKDLREVLGRIETRQTRAFGFMRGAAAIVVVIVGFVELLPVVLQLLRTWR
ncbi:hypothetical protein [Pseudomonas schmalbachii]|uniref:Uncharacterized protein n=1 Tax=Pseudomonas schmalbachii TaxID=2816993 RepID=A0ABS3TN83_9PSED|nr:hypothetical protein [Pseudomonas schmalbachii]MBO3274140.1 hypothetical protein [Pseudomonas schmalbachii]